MGNEQFEDIFVLKTLVRLKKQGLLHPDDEEVLISRLQTPWGVQAAKALLTGGGDSLEAARSMLRRFSEAA